MSKHGFQDAQFRKATVKLVMTALLRTLNDEHPSISSLSIFKFTNDGEATLWEGLREWLLNCNPPWNVEGGGSTTQGLMARCVHGMRGPENTSRVSSATSRITYAKYVASEISSQKRFGVSTKG